MGKWIEADALKKEIKQDIADAGLTERFVFYRINSAPSIDIVRCKECKHWHSGNCWGIPFSGDDASYIETESDDFCSYGEREGE